MSKKILTLVGFSSIFLIGIFSYQIYNKYEYNKTSNQFAARTTYIGGFHGQTVGESYGIRPVVAIDGNKITRGTGSAINQFVIQ